MSNKPPPHLPELNVYVAHEGKTWGPYDIATLQRHVNDRKFLPSDLANIVGSDNWQPLNTVASFPVEKQEVHIHHKEKKKTGCVTWAVVVIFVCIVLSIITSDNSTTSRVASTDHTSTATETFEDYSEIWAQAIEDRRVPKQNGIYCLDGTPYTGWTRRLNPDGGKVLVQMNGGKIHGLCLRFYSNGQMEGQLDWRNGKQHGFASMWDRSGNSMGTIRFEYGVPVERVE